MVIDIHAHIIVPEITRGNQSKDSWRPAISREEGKQYIDFGGKKINSALREFVDIDLILEEQDKAGVDRLVLTPWSSLFRYGAEDLAVSLETNRIQNDAMSKIMADHAPRLTALGTVPMQDSEAAVSELKRAVNDLGLLGVEIGTNVNGVYLGDDRFRPFWAAAAELDIVVAIHPVPGIGGKTKGEYYLWNAFANPAETALTASHMILSGLLEEFPTLKVCLYHGGGHLPYQIGRLDRAWEMRPEARQRITEPPSAYLRKFYFDTVTHSAPALEYLINLVGVQQVMVGSDYPFDMGYDYPADLVRSLNLPDADQQAILQTNAMRVFNLEN